MRAWRQGDHYLLHYADGAAFRVEQSSVQGTWFGPGSLDNSAAYLLGPVLALVLRLRGETCLHASAVCNANGAVVCAGAAEAGKSTMAAALIARGWSLLSDDLVPLTYEMGWRVDSGYPALRLWPETAASLYGGEDFPASSATWAKRVVNQGQHFSQGSFPLRAIFILQRGKHTSLRSLGGAEAAMMLVENSYLNYLPDADLQSQALTQFARLAQEVPVFLLQMPDDLERLAISAGIVQTIGGICR